MEGIQPKKEGKVEGISIKQNFLVRNNNARMGPFKRGGHNRGALFILYEKVFRAIKIKSFHFRQ